LQGGKKTKKVVDLSLPPTHYAGFLGGWRARRERMKMRVQFFGTQIGGGDKKKKILELGELSKGSPMVVQGRDNGEDL